MYNRIDEHNEGNYWNVIMVCPSELKGNYWNVNIAGYNEAKDLVTTIGSRTCYIYVVRCRT